MRGIRGVRIAKRASKIVEKKVQKEEQKEKEKEKAMPQPQPQLGESLFGVTSMGSTGTPSNPFANPFSSGANGTAASNPFASAGGGANPFAKAQPEAKTATEKAEAEASTSLPQTFADKVRLSSPPPSAQPARPHEPWPSSSDFPPAYPHFYLDAEFETLDAPSTPQIPANVRMMDVETESSGGGGGKEDKEIFESTLDTTFQKFADRVGQNPEQVLRYEFQGKPLLYSDADAVGKLLAAHAEHGSSSSNAKVTTVGRGASGMPRCGNCGADRVFEVQLTPHAITELEADELSIDGMEWGTIILGTCSNDCTPSDVREGEVGYVEEWVGVQWEEVAPRK